MPYHLNTANFALQPSVVIVGCGGTGAFVAEGICRLFTGTPAEIILIDHDTVEPHNLLRQAFYQEDIGQYKSKTLARRLSAAYQRVIGYSTSPFTQDSNIPSLKAYKSNSIIIGCVDNAQARRAMDSPKTHSTNWIVDAGNGFTWGQILIGNQPEPSRMHQAFVEDQCYRLPTPVLQRPEILTAQPHTPAHMDCAAALDLTDQDPTINQMMAAWVVHIVRRMFAQNCPFMALDLDLDQGTTVPTYATPQNVARLLDIPEEPLSLPFPQLRVNA